MTNLEIYLWWHCCLCGVDMDTFALGTMQQVRDRIRAEAEKYPVNRVVDCSGFIPPISDFFADKTLHPNALSHTFYAEGLLPEVKKLLSI